MKMIRFFLIIICSSLFYLSSMAQAKTPFEAWLIGAEQGSAESQFLVGYHYLYGRAVPKDEEKAFEWLLKAAKQGHLEAQTYLGYQYMTGAGVQKDKRMGLEWFLKAAHQGHAPAQFNVAKAYENGDGVPKDWNKFFEWSSKAAEQGHVKAQYDMGLCYENGRGVTKDINKAFGWYLKAATQGFANAQYYVGVLYETGKGTNKDEIKAFEWYTEAAKQGQVNALFNIGVYYEHGRGVSKDEKEAFKFFAQAGLRGHIKAQCKAAEMCSEGRGVVKDEKEAFKWYYYAALQEDAQAQLIVGNRYEFGNGVVQDYSQAVKWYQNALVNNINRPEVYTLLANLYYNGTDEVRDKRKAAEIVSKGIAYADKSNYSKIEILAYKGELYTIIEDRENALAMWNEIASINDFYFRKETKFSKYVQQFLVSDVDKNIPQTTIPNENMFAIIVAEENYEFESKVPYAHNDGRIFAEYCAKTLGVPARNIKYLQDATLNDILFNINWVKDVMKAYNGEAKIIFYYAGHGIPDEANKTAYLLPVDGFGSDISTGYALDELYTSLGESSAQSITVLLDACFSGTKREGEMLASARGIAIKAKPGKPKGNMVVFSASQGDETAYPFNEQKHGMFTYYLLKKLQETKGDVTLGELSEFVQTKVNRQSVVINGKLQTPTLLSSAEIGQNWQNWKLK